MASLCRFFFRFDRRRFFAIFLSASVAAGIKCRGIFTVASPNAMCVAWSSVWLAISMTFLVTLPVVVGVAVSGNVTFRSAGFCGTT